MKRIARLIFPLFLLPLVAHGQGVFYNSDVTTSAANVPAGASAPVLTLPGAIVTVCGYPGTPATGSPCTNKVSLFSDQFLTVPISNPITADQKGRFQFWVAPNLLSYSIQTQAGSFQGNFPLSLSSIPGPAGPSGASTQAGFISAAAYLDTTGTFAQMMADASTQNSTITISGVTPLPNGTTTVSADRNPLGLGGGQFTCPTGTCTLAFSGGDFDAPTDHAAFGANVVVTGLKVARPEWFAVPTVFNAVNAISSNGGSVLLGWSTYQSGSFTLSYARSNVSIQGVYAPLPDGTLTPAFVAGSGTIVKGPITFIGSNLSFSDFGEDIGDTFGDCAVNGLSVTPNSIAAPMLYNIRVRNVTTIACDFAFASTAQQHSLLFEHITGLVEENITTVGGYFGNVVKAIDVQITNLNSSGTTSSCGIVKSDDLFGVAAHVTITGLTMNNCGDQFTLDTFGATVSDVTITDIHATNMVGGVFLARGLPDATTGAQGFVDNVKISGGYMTNTSGNDVMSFMSGVTNVELSHLSIVGAAAGRDGIVFQELGKSDNSATDISISGLSSISPNGGYGITSFGQTDSVSDIRCTSVQLACVASSGNTPQPGLLRISNITSDTPVFFSFPNSSVIYADQGAWQTPTFTNGWTAFGASNSAPQYRLDRGRVYLKGLIVPGATATVTTLPPGFVPLEIDRFAADGFTGAAFGVCEVLIAPSGVVQVTNYTTCATSYVSLDGISFPIQ
jgi:hypothetical protein